MFAQTTPHLLMSPPDHFEVSYAINPWMQPADWAHNAVRLRADALRGWQALRQTYVKLGATVVLQPPVQGLPDLVFTANCAVVLDRKVLLAQFRPIERRGEQAYGRVLFDSLVADGQIDSIHTMPPGIFFEGAGDAIWDASRQWFWTGHGQRSSESAGETITDVFQAKTQALRLVDARFYHLDTCFCVLSGGEILYYPPAFDAPSLALIRSIAGGSLIEANDDDAIHLGVNSVCWGRDIVMGYCSGELQSQLTSCGYRVHRVDLGSFNRSGGSAYCLTLRLDNKSR